MYLIHDTIQCVPISSCTRSDHYYVILLFCNVFFLYLFWGNLRSFWQIGNCQVFASSLSKVFIIIIIKIIIVVIIVVIIIIIVIISINIIIIIIIIFIIITLLSEIAL